MGAPIIPLLLRSFGRTGTTVVMQLLGTSPNVLFDRVYPFEHRLLAYAARLGMVASLPTDNGEDWNPDALFQAARKRVGPLPYPAVPVLDRSSFGRKAARGAMLAMLDSLDTKGTAPERPLYYAEKIPLDLPPLVSALFDQTRSILLLRDPRDELLSIRAFNDKRGTLAFGWRSDDTDRSFAERHIDARRAFLREFAAAKGDERLFKLRYEDLMREGRAVAEALGAWLGVELSWEPVTGSVAEFAHHVTSATPEESVERWRRELSPEVAELFRRRLGDELRAVGYEL